MKNGRGSVFIVTYYTGGGTVHNVAVQRSDNGYMAYNVYSNVPTARYYETLSDIVDENHGGFFMMGYMLYG